MPAHERGPRFSARPGRAPPKGLFHFDDGNAGIDDGGGGGALPVSEATGLLAPGVVTGGWVPGILGSASAPARFGMGAGVEGGAVTEAGVMGGRGVPVSPVGWTGGVDGGGGTLTEPFPVIPVCGAAGVPKWSLMLLGAGGGVVSKPRLSCGRRVFCIVGVPPASVLPVAVGAGGVVASASAGLPAPLLFKGADPPETLEKPVVVDSGPFTVAVDIEAGVPVVAGVVATVLRVGVNVVGVLKRLLLLWQQSQPANAIPAQATLIRPITGFLPIANPFPRRNEPRARQPLRGREVGAVTRIQSSPVID
jgi:hypothetical protein